MENAWLATQGAGGPLDDLISHSITCRIAVGPRTGQKPFTLQTVPAREEEAEQQGDGRSAVNASGFSLHAALDIQPHQREKLERLCRYVNRPPIAGDRLALMARLAALVPPPRMHLTRFHGVFAPHSKLRAAVTPAHRGIGRKGQGDQADPDHPITPRHVAASSRWLPASRSRRSLRRSWRPCRGWPRIQIGIRGGQNFMDGIEFSERHGMRIVFMEEFARVGVEEIIAEARRVVARARPTLPLMSMDWIRSIHPTLGRRKSAATSSRCLRHTTRRAIRRSSGPA